MILPETTKKKIKTKFTLASFYVIFVNNVNDPCRALQLRKQDIYVRLNSCSFILLRCTKPRFLKKNLYKLGLNLDAICIYTHVCTELQVLKNSDDNTDVYAFGKLGFSLIVYIPILTSNTTLRVFLAFLSACIVHIAKPLYFLYLGSPFINDLPVMLYSQTMVLETIK